MGRDKAFLEIDGEPLWQRQLDNLRKFAPEQLHDFRAGARGVERLRSRGG